MSVTMLALARFTLKGPYQAALVVGLLAVLAVFIPPMVSSTVFGVLVASLCMLLSCTLVGLIILTQGSVSGFHFVGRPFMIGWSAVRVSTMNSCFAPCDPPRPGVSSVVNLPSRSRR